MKFCVYLLSIAATAAQNPSGVDSFNPSMSGEDAFIKQSNERLEALKKQNETMIRDDKEMMKEGYDPNEIYPNKKRPPTPVWNPPSGEII
jgi:hypothetical protein